MEVNTLSKLLSRSQIFDDILNAVKSGSMSSIKKSLGEAPVLARTAAEATEGYAPIGISRLKDINELNFGYGLGNNNRNQILLNPDMLDQGRLSGLSSKLDDIGHTPQAGGLIYDFMASNPGKSLADYQEMALKSVMPQGYHVPVNSRNELQDKIYGNSIGDNLTHNYAELNANIRPQDILATRNLPSNGMGSNNQFIDKIANELINSKDKRSVINKYMLSTIGSIPTIGVLGNLLNSDSQK